MFFTCFHLVLRWHFHLFIKDVDPSRVGTLDWVAAWRWPWGVTKFGTCLDQHEILAPKILYCSWLLKNSPCLILQCLIGCCCVFLMLRIYAHHPTRIYWMNITMDGEIWGHSFWWLCWQGWGGEDFAKSEFSKMIEWPMAIAPFGCWAGKGKVRAHCKKQGSTFA